MSEHVTLTRKFEFSASHRYWREDWSPQKNEAHFGASISPFGHGHNYELYVTVQGPIDPDTGMIINLTDLKALVNDILQGFDHKFLNMDTPYFKTQIPTTENIAAVLFELIAEKLSSHPDIVLKRIRLYGRSDLYAEVWKE